MSALPKQHWLTLTGTIFSCSLLSCCQEPAFLEENYHRTVYCSLSVRWLRPATCALLQNISCLPPSTTSATLGLEQQMHLTWPPASKKLLVLRRDVPHPGAVFWGSELCPVTSMCSPVSTSVFKYVSILDFRVNQEKLRSHLAFFLYACFMESFLLLIISGILSYGPRVTPEAPLGLGPCSEP